MLQHEGELGQRVAGLSEEGLERGLSARARNGALLTPNEFMAHREISVGKMVFKGFEV